MLSVVVARSLKHRTFVRYVMRSFSAAGVSRRPGAFVVAVNQACEGGEKRWYASTLELQLTSLELCKACRSVGTLRMHVDSTSQPMGF